MKFLRDVFVVIVGMMIYTGFVFGMMFMMIMGMSAGAGSFEKPIKEIKENSILKLNIGKQIVERTTEDDPFAEIDLPFGTQVGKMGLINLVKVLEKAKTDDKIKGIYIDASTVSSGYASLEVIRKALLDFKESGKFIVSYAEVMSEGAYYLASVSDEIYLYPEGMMEFNGLSTEIMYFTGLFEKLGIDVEIFKVGDFKSAVEPFFRKDMSDYNRQQTTSFLNSLYDHYLKQVGKSINKSYDELKMISDSMLVRDSEDAVKYGLVTKVAYWDEVQDILKEKTDTSLKKLRFVSFANYSRSISLDKKDKDDKDKGKVAVIIATGEIISGKSTDRQMGSETISKAIRKAREDSTVKAVVLRVNSPGGSALASDVMWREVVLTKEVKPIIASMSDVAASGGYYISMSCDKIVAEPNTITGSIGVFGMLPNLKDFWNEKLGITFDGVKTGEFSDLPNINRKMTEYEKAVIQNSVEKTYADFTSKAAEGRGMPVEELRKIASGRVWSGLEAIENGLVDELGGLDKALEIAATQANLDSNYRVVYFPKKKNFFEQLFGQMEENVKGYYEEETIGEFAPYFRQLKKVRNYQGIQARMPYDLNIR